eukprot:gene3290-4141_t
MAPGGMESMAGYVDDVHGYDFVNEDADPFDDNQHGTHCAGVIGAAGNNSLGVIGVAPRVRLMALKFLSGSGTGYVSDVIRAMEYALAMGAHITSHSWGGLSEPSSALSAVIDSAAAAGQLFVAAAGNEQADLDATPLYPAAFPQSAVITVAASTSSDTLSYFSNFGAASVDLLAPGSSILSTVPGGGYLPASGTSMAAAHVAGAAALLLAVDPELSGEQLKRLLLDSTDPLLGARTICASEGRLNVGRAIARLKDDPTIRGTTSHDSLPDSGHEGVHVPAEESSLTGTIASLASSSYSSGATLDSSETFQWYGLAEEAVSASPEPPTPCPLTSTAQQFVQEASAVVAPLPDLYPFIDGTASNKIADGGGDMYDNANYINVGAVGHALATRLAYTQSVRGARQAGSGDITYLTYKVASRHGTVWLAAFDSESGGIRTFHTSGNNGADGFGSAAYGSLGESAPGSGWFGWYKRVAGTSDPSINHLIIAPRGDWIHSASTDTNNDLHTVSAPLPSSTGGVPRLYYLLWAGQSGGLGVSYTTAQFRAVLAGFVERTPAAPSALVVHLDAAELPTVTLRPGESHTELVVVYNDGEREVGLHAALQELETSAATSGSKRRLLRSTGFRHHESAKPAVDRRSAMLIVDPATLYPTADFISEGGGRCRWTDTLPGNALRNTPHTIVMALTFNSGGYGGTREWLLNVGHVGSGAEHWLWRGGSVIQFGTWTASGSHPQITNADIGSATATLATVWDGSTYTLYIDGVVAASSSTTSFDIRSGDLRIGITAHNPTDFGGCIHQLWIYRRSLSPGQANSMLLFGTMMLSKGVK